MVATRRGHDRRYDVGMGRLGRFFGDRPVARRAAAPAGFRARRGHRFRCDADAIDLFRIACGSNTTLADAYRAAGVVVHYVERGRIDKPNAMFVRDLMLMTPEGAIVTRPASTVRAGEERLVAEALAQLGVPILMSVHGSGTFEGADVIWVDKHLCFLAEGLRTNEEGANQVERMLREIGVAEVVRVGLPHGAMHLDGLLAIDRDLAVVWPRRTFKVVNTLRKRGFRFIEVDDEREAQVACR